MRTVDVYAITALDMSSLGTFGIQAKKRYVVLTFDYVLTAILWYSFVEKVSNAQHAASITQLRRLLASSQRSRIKSHNERKQY
jgi:hypothetical protein